MTVGAATALYTCLAQFDAFPDAAQLRERIVVGAGGAAAWMSRYFSRDSNPPDHDLRFYYYYLASVARLGRATTTPPGLIDMKWYAEGCTRLVETQDQKRGSWGTSGSRITSTSFALIFLRACGPDGGPMIRSDAGGSAGTPSTPK